MFKYKKKPFFIKYCIAYTHELFTKLQLERNHKNSAAILTHSLP